MKACFFNPSHRGARIGQAVKDEVNIKMMLNSGCFKVSPRVKGCGGGVKA